MGLRDHAWCYPQSCDNPGEVVVIVDFNGFRFFRSRLWRHIHRIYGASFRQRLAWFRELLKDVQSDQTRELGLLSPQFVRIWDWLISLLLYSFLLIKNSRSPHLTSPLSSPNLWLTLTFFNSIKQTSKQAKHNTKQYKAHISIPSTTEPVQIIFKW